VNFNAGVASLHSIAALEEAVDSEVALSEACGMIEELHKQL
jgi:hypothetical protein